MAGDTSVDRKLPVLYKAGAGASAPPRAALPCVAYARRGTPPAFMPPSMTSSLPVT